MRASNCSGRNVVRCVVEMLLQICNKISTICSKTQKFNLELQSRLEMNNIKDINKPVKKEKKLQIMNMIVIQIVMMKIKCLFINYIYKIIVNIIFFLFKNKFESLFFC